MDVPGTTEPSRSFGHRFLLDVLADRGRRIALTKKRYEVYGGSRRGSGSDTALLMRRDISAEAQKVMANLVLQNDRRLRALEANATREDELLQGVLLGMVSTPLWRRLLGPGLIVAGIIVGTVANICAS